MTMNTSSSKSRVTTGKITVVLILLVGLAAAYFTWSWWTMQAREHNDPATVEKRQEEANRRIREIGKRFTDHVAENRDASSFLQPAKRVVEQYPDNYEARNLYGQVLHATGNNEQALEHFEHSLQLNERQAETASLAGTLSMQLERWDDAAKYYSHAVGLERNNARYHLFLAKAYIKQNETERARKKLLEALQYDSNSHEAHAELSDLYAMQGKMELALDQVEKAIELMGPFKVSQREQFVFYVRKKSKLLRRMNQPEDALMTLRDNLTYAEELVEPNIVAEMATSLVMMGDPQSAVALYETAAQQHANSDLQAVRRLVTAAFDLNLRLKRFDEAAHNIVILREVKTDEAKLKDLQDRLKTAEN